MKTFIQIASYSGQSCDDSYSSTNYLQENGRFEIEHPDEVIAKYVLDQYHRALDYSRDCKNIEKATEKDIMAVLKAKKGQVLMVGTDPEIWEGSKYYDCADWFGYDDKGPYFKGSYAGGQFTDHKYINIMHIEDSSVRYLAAETFRSPGKYVPAVSRFYDLPAKTQEEAKLLLDKIELHKFDEAPWLESVKELYIQDVDKLTSTIFWAENVTAIRLTEELTNLAKNRQVNIEIPFAMYASDHCRHLQNKINELLRSKAS